MCYIDLCFNLNSYNWVRTNALTTRIVTGTVPTTKFFNVRVQGLVEALKAHNIDHEYYSGGHGGHDWSTWRHLLYYRFLRNVFKGENSQS